MFAHSNTRCLYPSESVLDKIKDSSGDPLFSAGRRGRFSLPRPAMRLCRIDTIGSYFTEPIVGISAELSLSVKRCLCSISSRHSRQGTPTFRFLYSPFLRLKVLRKYIMAFGLTVKGDTQLNARLC